MFGVLLSGDAYPRCKQVSPDCSLWHYQFRRQLPTRSLHQSCWPEVWQYGQSHRPAVWATPAQAATAHRCLGPSHRAAQGRMSYQCRTREALWLVGIREDEDKFSETRSKTRGWGARGCAWRDQGKRQVEAATSCTCAGTHPVSADRERGARV